MTLGNIGWSKIKENVKFTEPSIHCIQVLLLYVVFELVRRFTLTIQQYFLEKNEEEGQS